MLCTAKRFRLTAIFDSYRLIRRRSRKNPKHEHDDVYGLVTTRARVSQRHPCRGPKKKECRKTRIRTRVNSGGSAKRCSSPGTRRHETLSDTIRGSGRFALLLRWGRILLVIPCPPVAAAGARPFPPGDDSPPPSSVAFWRQNPCDDGPPPLIGPITNAAQSLTTR